MVVSAKKKSDRVAEETGCGADKSKSRWTLCYCRILAATRRVEGGKHGSTSE